MTLSTLGDMASDLPSLPENKRHISLHQLFEAQVERTPGAIAVICDDQRITYHELNVRANHLAHHLQALGVHPEVLVGLCVDRSVDLVVGLLGILKSGGAYVPIDPDYPSERLAFILEDTQAPVLVTQRHLTAKLAAHHSRSAILDMNEAIVTQQNDSSPVNAVKGEHLAYVIYTSGSTGQPKGVLIEHRAIAIHCLTIAQIYELRAEDTILQFSTFTFDASLEQILPALLVGARIVMRGQEIWSPIELLRKVKEFELTVMDLSPAYLHLVLEEWKQIPEQLLGHKLRLVIVGGDSFIPEIAELWPDVPLQSVRLLNAYGPTETTITATLLEVVSAGRPLEKISIGRPLPNRTTYILDKSGGPAAIGTAGELYIGGDLLARGYLNRPELTAERFLADPFSQVPHARLYKTGDRARYLPDGAIEFLGRVDYQVKIRGFRIELGEIEAVISQHPAVRQAVVVAREDRPGDQSLVAYVVFHKGQAAAIDDLKQHVLQRLPDYMAPSAFVVLEVLPLTASGKVDRRSLPPPESRRLAGKNSFVAPTLPLHSQLARIWEDLLDARPIGITDDFFDLGGHSLLAARLFDRIEQVCGKRLPISTLYTGATIEYLATALTGETEADPVRSNIQIHTDGSQLPFFYLHGQVQADSTLHCYSLARALGPDRPFYGLKSYPLLDNQRSLPTLEEMAEAQLKTIRAIQPEGPYFLGGCCNGGLVAYEMARQLEAAGQTVALLLLIDPAFLVYPPALKTYHAIFEQVSKLLRLRNGQQVYWALRLKHLARTLFFALLRRKDPDQLAFSDLSQNYFRLYDWIALKYRPSSWYRSKTTFFWAKEGQEAQEYRKGWQAIEMNCDVEIHLLPGNHITCRTDHLSVLAEQLNGCVRAAQETSFGSP